MRVVFIKKDCLSRYTSVTTGMCLQSGVLDGLQTLRRHDLLVALMDPEPRPADAPRTGDTTDLLLRLLARGGAKVDAVIRCPHPAGTACGCWGDHAGFLRAAGDELDLRLSECYLICDDPADVSLAYQTGCRPILVLGGREIGSMCDGHQPDVVGFPLAPDFNAAVRYISCEEEANELWGHTRQPSVPSGVEEVRTAATSAEPEFSPSITLMSPVRIKNPLLPSFAPLNLSARRYLALFITGGVLLSLGIAYLLAHMYRVQPFPQFVWYLTLQFIPRWARGLLFIIGGMAVVALSLRAFSRLVPNHKTPPRT